ncbi:hypothetical protein [uncultured Clostridium sp.]|nr:hypothetical protein [uncultured Clostridium sp.]
MAKVTIKYENETEKKNIIKCLSIGTKIKAISKPQKAGKYFRIYIELV